MDADTGALLEHIRRRHGADVDFAEPPSSKTEGFDSAVHLVAFTGGSLPESLRGPLVFRVKSDAGRHAEAEREAAIHGWLVERRYPAPRIVETYAPGELLDRPAQLMERVPGRLMIDVATKTPWRLRATLAVLADLHVRLHRLPVDDFPATEDVLDRRLRLVRRMVETTHDAALTAGLERVEAMAPKLRSGDQPVSVCHGDFHPLNVLVTEDGRGGVIDWTDAGLGDRHGDVARTLALFDLAAIAASNPAERLALRVFGPRLGARYRGVYEAQLPLDPQRLALWTPVHLLHGWSQAMGGHDRVGPGLVDELRRRFERAMAQAAG